MAILGAGGGQSLNDVSTTAYYDITAGESVKVLQSNNQAVGSIKYEKNAMTNILTNYYYHSGVMLLQKNPNEAGGLLTTSGFFIYALHTGGYGNQTHYIKCHNIATGNLTTSGNDYYYCYGNESGQNDSFIELTGDDGSGNTLIAALRRWYNGSNFRMQPYLVTINNTTGAVTKSIAPDNWYDFVRGIVKLSSTKFALLYGTGTNNMYVFEPTANNIGTYTTVTGAGSYDYCFCESNVDDEFIIPSGRTIYVQSYSGTTATRTQISPTNWTPYTIQWVYYVGSNTYVAIAKTGTSHYYYVFTWDGSTFTSVYNTAALDVTVSSSPTNKAYAYEAYVVRPSSKEIRMYGLDATYDFVYNYETNVASKKSGSSKLAYNLTAHTGTSINEGQYGYFVASDGLSSCFVMFEIDGTQFYFTQNAYENCLSFTMQWYKENGVGDIASTGLYFKAVNSANAGQTVNLTYKSTDFYEYTGTQDLSSSYVDLNNEGKLFPINSVGMY